MKKITIDLNCDMGEGIGNEADLMPHISSCNIACGGHAGDPATMERVARLAREHGVRIGAHPSYPDRANFGRRSMGLSQDELQGAIQTQLQVLEAALVRAGAELRHIKAHGALYNDLARNGDLAEVYLRILTPYRERVALFLPAGSGVAARARAAGFDVWEEAFADRAYHRDGRLVSRSEPGALLTDPPQVFDRVRDMARLHRVISVEGDPVPIYAQTFCLHGDTPGALEILMYLTRELPKESIRLSQ